jgi:hypothetical protein
VLPRIILELPDHIVRQNDASLTGLDTGISTCDGFLIVNQSLVDWKSSVGSSFDSASEFLSLTSASSKTCSEMLSTSFNKRGSPLEVHFESFSGL